MGGTIGELQNKITHREYILWTKYRKKYGPLNPIRMYDRSGAIVAHQINQANKGKAKVLDFIPWGKDEVEEDEIKSAEEVTMGDYIKAVLGGKVNIGKRKRR